MLANVIRLRKGDEESVVAIDSTNVPLIPKFKSVRIVAKLIEE